MNPKGIIILSIVGFAAYTLGAKAGTSRYKEITKAFTKHWNDPQVKKARKKAKKARVRAQKAATKRFNAITSH